MWVFYELEGDGLDQTKKIYRRIPQLVIPFVHLEEGEVKVDLRGISGLSVTQDFLNLIRQANIQVEKVALTEEEKAAQTEAEAKAAEEEKARLEAEALEAKEVPWSPEGWEALGTFDTAEFSETGLVLAPQLTKDDLYTPLSEPPAPQPIPVVEPVVVEESEEEKQARLNALGGQTFVSDGVHNQLASLYRLLVNNFHLVVSLIVDKDTVPRTKLHPTVFCIDDIQHKFSTNFEAVSAAESLAVHLYPVRITAEEDTLWLEKTPVTEFHEIQVPNKFRFVAQLAKDGKYALTSAEVVHEEAGPEATPLLNALVERFLSEFKQLAASLAVRGVRAPQVVRAVPTARSAPIVSAPVASPAPAVARKPRRRQVPRPVKKDPLF
jgi:hypothetical protein